jgi:hypothetical protein
MKYLQGTVEIPLTLEIDDNQLVRWWIDGSFAVQPDMKSHTGGFNVTGKGGVYGTSTRNKLVMKSSTELQLVWGESCFAPGDVDAQFPSRPGILSQ